ncbi:hypothetical protein [Pseudochryseolinea flava]|uniref:Lipocalin-like domain-containing protein n=1 Tax=Pseudochryseolinea flava TaxID=2059302 RepID=A0A364XX15_9BACT|nr:hypothetical protein [Pseudochryseolinea flava]RAV98784.1 hypothetical protein DQQ10_22465 [Pseudochryseolinea flava]
MKHLSRILSLLVLVCTALFLTNCGSDGGDEPSAADKQLELLVGTWKITAASFEGAAKTEFVNSTLSITSGKTFAFDAASTIVASPWPTSGTFEFGSDITSQLTFVHGNGDNIPATYSVSGNTLSIDLNNYTGENYDHEARVAVVEGDWKFTLTKN